MSRVCLNTCGECSNSCCNGYMFGCREHPTKKVNPSTIACEDFNKELSHQCKPPCG